MRLEETEHFDTEGFSGDVYVPNEAQKGFTALRVVVHGKHPLKRMIDTTRTYFVIKGSGTFTLNGTSQEVKAGDLYIVEPGSQYEYEGEMELFEVNISPENSFKDERLG